MGIAEKIAEIEYEMSRTQKNKATEHHLGGLKAKLAKYRAELLEPAGKGPKGEGFDVMKCFTKGTMLVRFDGGLIDAADVIVGDRLVGPDGKLRTVGQVHIGNDSVYNVSPVALDQLIHDKLINPMLINYRLLMDSYQCNGNHVLILTIKNKCDPIPVESFVWENEQVKFAAIIVKYDEATNTLEKYVSDSIKINKPSTFENRESVYEHARLLLQKKYGTPSGLFELTVEQYTVLDPIIQEQCRQVRCTGLNSYKINMESKSSELNYELGVLFGNCMQILSTNDTTFTMGEFLNTPQSNLLFSAPFAKETVAFEYIVNCLVIPSSILQGPLRQVRHAFVNGLESSLISGDGCINYDQLTRLNERLANELVFLLRSSHYQPYLAHQNNLKWGLLGTDNNHSNEQSDSKPVPFSFTVIPCDRRDTVYGFTLIEDESGYYSKAFLLKDFTVAHNSGDARVAMIGYPSVGKSTLLSKCTKTASAVASYEFTTLTCIPGVIEHKGSEIQLLDLPGIIEGAADGKGRGKQVISVARTADMVLMILDASKGMLQREKLEKELYAVGIRLNAERPNIYFKEKKTGGIHFTATVPMTQTDERVIVRILTTYRIFNADIIFRGDYTDEQFIDVVMGNIIYMKCLYVYNKVDCITIEEVDQIAREPHTMVISCQWDLNLDRLIDQIWADLALVRVFTKKRGEYPDFNNGLILRNGSTVEHACHSIHRNLISDFKFGLVWGKSVKFSPMRVGLVHKLDSDDVLQIIKKSQK